MRLQPASRAQSCLQLLLVAALIACCAAVDSGILAPYQQIIASDVSNLLAILQSNQVDYNVTLTGACGRTDMHLNPQNWPNTINVTTTLFLQGDANDEAQKRVLISNNTDYEIEPSCFNLSCEAFNDAYIHNIGTKYPVVESTDGLSVTIYTPDGPIIDKQSIVDANVTGARPHVLNSAITRDEPASSAKVIAAGNVPSVAPASSSNIGTGNGGSTASTGAIAGAVAGAVAGAILLALLGFVVLRRRRRTKSGRQDTQATERLRRSVSGSISTTSSNKQSEQQWYFANPLQQLEAAGLMSGSSSHSSSKASRVDDGSSVGQLSGAPPPAQAKGERFTMQFDWHIQPHRLTVVGGRDATPIGIGAYGVVYEGILDGFKPVAIKFLHPATCPKASSHTARFMEEDLVYMVLELMETDLLRALGNDQLHTKQPPNKRVLGWYNKGSSIALDILNGLHYLHANRVVHLDMKSANILLAHDKTAKIADVGLASTLSKSTLSEHHRGGTLAWQSPEMLMGKPASFSADMWSFGVILLEIVTGVLFERGRYHTPEVPGECPAQVADLIKRCMASAPEDRPTALEAIQIVMVSTGEASASNFG
ncbi:hypothetical protein WJX73_004921 [Symbiochloris irregularis]|uniref:Protein kinase domain-containing protein n=1 Tax=Symbiochloris irregularis TaxID=706552 RepID=A0AAW1NS75_9CHLO